MQRQIYLLHKMGDVRSYVKEEKEQEYTLGDFKLVVCDSIGDGSCFFHSILFAVLKREYIASDEKEEYALQLRNAVADYLVEKVEEDNSAEIRSRLEDGGIELDGDILSGKISLKEGDKEVDFISKKKELTPQSRIVNDIEFMLFSANMKLNDINLDAGRLVSRLRRLGTFADDSMISKTIEFLDISLLILERKRKKLTATLYRLNEENNKYIIIHKTGAHYQAVFPKIGDAYYDFLNKKQAFRVEELIREK